MTSPRKFHLFNCDRVYKLDSIEYLLLTTTRNLGIEISVKQHYFTVSEITEFSDQTIPTLEMDAAILAVNANESRLSINENTEGGYTKVYRALLQATGKAKLEVEHDRSLILRIFFFQKVFCESYWCSFFKIHTLGFSKFVFHDTNTAVYK